MFKVKEGLKLFDNQTTVRYPTGTYGSFEIDGGAKNSYEGFSIGGRAVFMHDNGTAMGLYNDVNNQWALLSYFGGDTRLYHAGNEKISTKSDGVQVQGLLKFNSTATTTSQNYGIEWTAFDKEGTTDYSDAAYIKHLTNTAGLGGSVLEISSMNDANDGINLKVNSSTAGARVNGNPIFHDAYHPNADKWTTARTHTVTLTGDVTGSASQSVDGTGNKTWTISTTVANDSHSHSNYVVANTTSNANIDSDWGQSFKTFDPIPSGTPPLSSPNIRTINVGENYARRTQIAFNYNTDQAWFRRRHNSTWHSWREFVHSGNIGSQSVNYATSAGNADTVDSLHASSFIRSDANDTFTGNLTTGADNHITFGPNSTWGSSLRVGGNGRTATGTEMASVVTTDGNLHLDAADSTNGIYLGYYAGSHGTIFGSGSGVIVARMDTSGNLYKSSSATNITATYWHSANDGSGSGLDADLLDGQHASAFAPASHSHNYVVEGGTSFNGEYPVVVRTSANTIYSDGNIRFQGSDSKLSVDGRVDAPIFYDINNTGYFLNPASGSNLNQIRTAGHISVGSHGDSAASTVNTTARITFGSLTTDAINNYSIGTTLENYGGNYNKLDLAFHTGIRLGAHPNYGGVRFFSDQTMGTEIASIGKSGDYILGNNSVRAPIFYDSNDTGYYADPASTSIFNDFRCDIMYDKDNTSYYARPGSTSMFNDLRGNIIYDRENTAYYFGSSHGDFRFRNGTVDALTASSYNGYDIGRLHRTENRTNGTAGAGWMTIAECTSARYHGEIFVTDGESSDHSFIRIDWMRSYADNNFTVLNCGGHANRITGARVLYQTSDTTYGRCVLQVYVTVSSNYYVRINRLGDIPNYGTMSAVTPVIQNSISGYAVHGNVIDNLDTYSLAAEEGIAAGGQIRAGSSTYSPLYYDLNDTGYYVDPNSTSRMNRIDPNEIYNYGWFRNHQVNEGAYNQATGVHAYSNASQTYVIAGNSSGSSVSLRLYSTHQSADRMWIHGGADGYWGFLNSGGQWQLRAKYADGTSPNLWWMEEGNETWSGDPTTDQGKIEYHSNRFYIAAGSNSTEIARFRRGGSDEVTISNDGTIYAYAYRGNENVAGTGEASYHPAGIYSTSNNWLYGAMYRNGSSTYMQGGSIYSTNRIECTQNYGEGVFGVYSSTRYQHVWSMGTAYKLASNGTSVGNLYGLSWTHTNVGTGTNQSIAGLSHQLQLRMNGSLYCAFGSGIWTSGNITAYSDIAVKTNLERIPNALEKVMAINGYTYDRTDYKADDQGIMPETRQAGVVAQEVEKVLPEVVSGQEGNKAVAYGNMVALLIEAIKEQQTQIEDLSSKLKSLKENNNGN